VLCSGQSQKNFASQGHCDVGGSFFNPTLWEILEACIVHAVGAALQDETIAELRKRCAASDNKVPEELRGFRLQTKH